MKIMIGTPCADDKVHRPYMQSLLTQVMLHPARLQQQEKYNVTFFNVGGQTGLGRDRGSIASFAMRNQIDKLFMIDSDQSWSWEQFKAIVDSDKPIIGGVVPLKRYPLHLNFTPKPEDQDCFEEDGGEVVYKGLLKLQNKHNPKRSLNIQDQEIEVNRLGTAFMCVDMAVFRSLASSGIAPSFTEYDPYSKKPAKSFDFFQSGVVNGLYHGEDWGFCHQAKHAGFKTYINPTVRIPHHGNHMFVLGEELVKL